MIEIRQPFDSKIGCVEDAIEDPLSRDETHQSLLDLVDFRLATPQPGRVRRPDTQRHRGELDLHLRDL